MVEKWNLVDTWFKCSNIPDKQRREHRINFAKKSLSYEKFFAYITPKSEQLFSSSFNPLPLPSSSAVDYKNWIHVNMLKKLMH